MCFFFKQKTAYDIEYGLVGSEMCIRDRIETAAALVTIARDRDSRFERVKELAVGALAKLPGCLLYTSDAADERSSVDLGGRRIIKKQNNHHRLYS